MKIIYYILFTASVNNDETNAQSEGPEKELLVNINCPLKLILNYIRDEVGLDGPSKRNIFSPNRIDYKSKEESFNYVRTARLQLNSICATK